MEHEERYTSSKRPCEQDAGGENCYHSGAHNPSERHGSHAQPEHASIPTQRNRYFMGKYMAARDFRLDQDYFLGRGHLHNRMLHGWGIVCGLRIEHHERQECRSRWVVIRAGIAIDCYGRELVLDQDWAIELPFDEHNGRDGEAEQEEGEDWQVDEYKGGRQPEEYLLCLHYHEQETQMVPVLYNENPCDPTAMEANRISEGVCWVLRRREDVGPLCWRTPQGGPVKCRPCFERGAYEEGTEGVPHSEPEQHSTCLDPRCPCDGFVPLALIRYPASQQLEDFEIDMEGRWQLAPAPALLTHIVHTNWKHGDKLPLSRLAGNMEGGLNGLLKIYFDRPIEPTPGPEEVPPCGISQYTFTVEHHVPRDDGYSVYTLFNDDDPPYLDENDPCVAVFPLPEPLLTGRMNLGRSTLVVRLKCDFILDCHQRPVDGNFLKGRMPTGDGVPGGVFESWFYVEADVAPAKPGRRGRQAPG